MLAAEECGGLTFDASFDSGNAARVESHGDDEFSIWTHADMEGTQYENKNRTWWSFSVRGVTKSRILHFNIHNMNSQGKLLRADMRPVFRIWPSKPNWARLPLAASYTGTKEEDNFVMRFRHKCECEPGDTIYFAFCFPHTYADNIARLAWLDALFGLPAATVAKPDTPTGQQQQQQQQQQHSSSSSSSSNSSNSGGGVDGGGGTLAELAHAPQSHAPPLKEAADAGSTSSGSSSSRTTTSVGLHHAAAADELALAAAPSMAAPAALPAVGDAMARKGSTGLGGAGAPNLLARAAAAALQAREAKERREGRTAQRERPEGGGGGFGGEGGGRGLLAAARAGPPSTSAPSAKEPNPANPPKPPAGVHDAALAAAGGTPEAAASPCLPDIAAAAVAAAAQCAPLRKPSGIYYHRELLCRSLEGRRVDLITISGTNGMQPQCEEDLGDPNCMPEGGSRPRRFAGKQCFLLTARVHPGEVPASHVLDGFLQFILREDDPRARALRERFVFKLVPIINPDGVFRGHYRSDTRGLNLNRVYLAPSAETHPAVHAITKVVRQLHGRGELQFYVDCHGHATKRGCFLYGNSLLSEPERMVDNVLYAKLCALNCRWFDFGGCVFSERNMYGRDKRDALSKEGSGRVATYKMTNLTYVYTLECNYNTGRIVNRLAAPHVPKEYAKQAVSPPPPPLKAVSPKYTPECWRSVGKALALSALDIVGANPCSRLGPPAAGGYARLRGTVAAWVKSYAKKEAKRKPVHRGGGSDEDEDEEEGGEEEGEEDADEDEEEDGGEEAADDVELRLRGGPPLQDLSGADERMAAVAVAANETAAADGGAGGADGGAGGADGALLGKLRDRFHLNDDEPQQGGAAAGLGGAAGALARKRSKSPRNSRSQSPRDRARSPRNSRPGSGRR